MKVVAALIKDSHVIDTYALDMAARDDLADAAKKAFAYFRDRYPSLTSTTNDLMIAVRDDDNAPTKCDRKFIRTWLSAGPVGAASARDSGRKDWRGAS